MTDTLTAAVLDPAALAEYQPRAAAIVDRFAALDPAAMQDADALRAELDERYVQPLTDAYTAVPRGLRADLQGMDDLDHQDAIWQLVHAFAGLAEFVIVHDGADGAHDAFTVTTAREAELASIAMRYRERFPTNG